MQLLIIYIVGKSIPIGIAILRYNRLPAAYRLLLVQVITALSAEIFGYYSSLHNTNNLWFFNFYWLFELWIMGILAFMLLKPLTTAKLVPVILCIATAIWLANIWQVGLSLHATLGISAINISLVVIYFVVLYNTIYAGVNTFKQPVFWLCFSTLLFYGCLLPYYGLFNYLYIHHTEILKSFFKILIYLDIIRYALVAISFYCIRYQVNEKPDTPDV